MIIISELNHLNDLSQESNLDLSKIVGGFGRRRRLLFVNQETIALADATAINGDATAIANAEGTFSSSPVRRKSRRRFSKR